MVRGHKPVFNLAVIGHLQSGKSSCCGQLLFRLNGRTGAGRLVDKMMIDRLEKAAAGVNRKPSKYAWVGEEEGRAAACVAHKEDWWEMGESRRCDDVGARHASWAWVWEWAALEINSGGT
jgi:hypothetical protein